MDALVSMILPGGQLTLWAGVFFAGIAAFVAAIFKARRSGVIAERAAQLQRDAKARDDADEIDRAVAGRDIDDVRKRLSQWGRK